MYAHLVIFIGSFIAFSLVFFLLTKKDRKKLDVYLALFLLSIGLFQVLHYLRVEGIMKEYLPHLLRVRFLIHGFTGALFFSYISESLSLPVSKVRKALIYLPAFLGAVLVVPYLLQSADFKREWEFSEFTPIAYYINYLIARGTLLFYCLLAWNAIKKKRNDLKKETYQWLAFITAAYFFSGLITSGITFVDFVIYDFVSYHWLHLSSTVLVTLIAVKAIREGHLSQQFVANSKTKSYQSSSLSKEQAGDILSRLDDLMEQQQLYLQSKLTLPETAKTLNESPHNVSQSLNQYRSIKFNDYVNQWRLERLIQQLEKGELEHITLLGIAMECGFNSKSSFNLAFKKYKGMSPTQFLKSMPNKKVA